jgi:hypothetical protein
MSAKKPPPTGANESDSGFALLTAYTREHRPPMTSALLGNGGRPAMRCCSLGGEAWRLAVSSLGSDAITQVTHQCKEMGNTPRHSRRVMVFLHRALAGDVSCENSS